MVVADPVTAAAGIIVAFLLVALNGFFVAAEFAYVRVRSTSVETFVEEGRAGAELLDNAVSHLDDYLAVCQLGITLSSLGLGWIGEPAVASLIEPVLGAFVPATLLHLVAFAIGFGFITFLHVVFGELAPKTIAIARAERVALLVSPLMQFFYYLFFPGLVVFNGTANFFTSLIGIPPASETDETLTEEEILLVLARSGREGEVDVEEVEMIERVFELDDTTVREAMVPRPDVVSVPADLPLLELRSLIVEAGHTRYPVLAADDPDRLVGFVDVKDVLRTDWTDDGAEGAITAGDIARDVPIVPETGRLDDLLAEFQASEVQMAAVIDEWGVFEGIATVEDVVEEVFGDLRDAFDAETGEPSIDRRRDGSYVVDGGVSLSDVNELLETDFEAEDFGTVGGLVLDRLGRAPEVGDRVEIDGFHLDVERVDGARVSRVVVRDLSTEEERSDAGEQSDGGERSDGDGHSE